MGKSKKRIFSKNSDENIGITLKRSEIIDNIIFDIKNNMLTNETKRLISLFGITTEELSEAGIDFEELSAVRHLLY